MSVKKELLALIYSREFLELARDFLKSNTEVKTFSRKEMGFRLCKYEKSKSATLEVFTQLRSFENDENKTTKIGIEKSIIFHNYFKPIGFYTMKGLFFARKVELTVINEFEDVTMLGAMIINKMFGEYDFIIKPLTLEENALVAAFSLETLLQAKKRTDVSFISNDLHCDIYISNEGFPQVFLNDRYGITGPIAAYFARSNSSVDPMVYNRKIYDKLSTLGLLTALERKMFQS